MNKPLAILLATGNAHKAAEFDSKLRSLGAGTLVSIRPVPSMPEVEENGATFEDNALIKASAVFQAFGQASLSDDSGLVVPAIGGEPGIHSARYAGAKALPAEKMAKLLSRMQGLDGPERYAYFECSIVCILPRPGKDLVITGCGKVEGEILLEPRGNGGFGYDPLFKPTGYNASFAEIPEDEKNLISHRGRAIENFLENLKKHGVIQAG